MKPIEDILKDGEPVVDKRVPPAAPAPVEPRPFYKTWQFSAGVIALVVLFAFIAQCSA